MRVDAGNCVQCGESAPSYDGMPAICRFCSDRQDIAKAVDTFEAQRLVRRDGRKHDLVKVELLEELLKAARFWLEQNPKRDRSPITLEELLGPPKTG